MSGEYKFYVRNEDNTAWVNILQDDQILLTGGGWGAGIDYVSDALADLAAQIGGPAYGGEKLTVTNTVAATDVTTELASISTRGGIEIYQNLIIGGNDSNFPTETNDQVALIVRSTVDTFGANDGAVQVSGGVSINKNLYVGGSIASVLAITTQDDIQGVNITATTLTTTDQLSVTTSVNSNLTPDTDGGHDLGEDLVRWGTGFFDTIDTANLITSGALSGSSLTTTGTTTTENLIVNGGITLDVDTVVTGNIVPVDTTRTIGSLGTRWNTVYAINLDVSNAISGTFNGTFVGDLTGDVIGTTVTADTVTATTSFQGDIEGNIIGDNTVVVSGFEIDVDGSDAFRVVGGMTVDKKAYFGADVAITGNITAANLDFANFNQSIVPDTVTPSGYDLGSATNRWDNVYVTTMNATTFSVTSVTGDLIGDVYASDGTSKVLEGGTDGTDATFSGDVTGDLNGNLTAASTSFLILSGTDVTASGVLTGGDLSITQAVSDVNPDVDNTRSLGTNLLRWSNVYGNTFTGSSFIGGSFAGSFLGDLAGDLIGALTTATGNVQVDGDLNVDGTLTATTLSISNFSGDLVGDVYASNGTSKVLENGTDGTDAIFTGNVTGDLTGNVNGTVTGNVNGTVTGNLSGSQSGGSIDATTITASGLSTFNNNVNITGNLDVTGTFQTTSLQGVSVIATGNTPSTSKDTGALIVTQGGMGVEGDVYIGGDIDVAGNVNFSTFTGDVTGDLTGNVAGDLTGDVYAQDGINIVLQNGTDGTDATFTGDLIGDLTKSTTVSVTNTTSSVDSTTGALVVAGGVGVTENLNVGGNATITGDLTINGTTTTVNSTTVTVADNTIVLNSGEVGSGVTSGFAGIEIDRGLLTTYQILFDESNDTFRAGETGNLQALATREDIPLDGGVPTWNATLSRFDTAWTQAIDLQTLTGGKYLCSSSVSTGLTLPATPAEGQMVWLVDQDGSWGTSPITINSNGSLMEGAVQNLVLNVPNQTLEMVYTTSKGWKII